MAPVGDPYVLSRYKWGANQCKKRKNMDLEVLGQYSHLCIRGDAATRTVLLQDAYSIRLITGFK